MDFILFMLRAALHILAVIGGFMALGFVLKHGSETMRSIFDTISLMAKAVGHWVRKQCIRYLIREKEAEEGKTHVEATVE